MERRVDGTGPEGPDHAAGGRVGPLGVLWRHKWIVALLTTVGCGLGYLYFLQCPTVYQSSAQVLIVKKEQSLIVQGLEVERRGNDSLSLHSLLLKSPKVISRAVEKHDLTKLPSYQRMADPTASIIGSLTVTTGGPAQGSSNLVGLTLQGSEPLDCSKVLTAVLDSYKEFLGNSYQDLSEETVQLITQAKDVLLKQLREKEEGYRKFRQESPLLWKGSQGSNLHEERMARIEAARAEAIVQVSLTKSRIAAIEEALKKGGNREAVALLMGNLSSTSETPGPSGAAARKLSPRNSFEDSLFGVYLEEQMLLEEFGPDHPNVKALQKRLNLMRKHLSSMAPSGADDPGREDFVNVYLESLRQETKLHEQTLAGLNTLFNTERNSAKTMAVFQVQDETFHSEISRTQQLFSAVVKRLDEINLIKDYAGITMQVVSPPGPGVQVAPKLTSIMMLAGMWGLLAGFGLGYCIEFLDRRFRNPEEVRRCLGLPILGHVPVIRGRAGRPAVAEGVSSDSPFAPVLCVAHRPRGCHAEAYRAVRTALYFSTRSQGHKVIQVTSPSPGDGKSTTAANLALSIADSGKRVVLVDGDFRRSVIHKLLSLENTVGLSQAIAGKAEPHSAILPTAVENLWAIPAGPRPSNPAELLTSARFKELIDVLREQYDYVVIDSPPVLAVTDPSVIAPWVDAVLVVLRLTKNARAAARQATETLTSLGAKILGIVVNGIGERARYGYGYSGYGSYTYGYGRYGYGSAYGHGYGDGDKACDDEQSQGPPRPSHGNGSLKPIP